MIKFKVKSIRFEVKQVNLKVNRVEFKVEQVEFKVNRVQSKVWRVGLGGGLMEFGQELVGAWEKLLEFSSEINILAAP